jgi:hypothetical protein
MGRLAPRTIFIFAVAFGIAVATPLHASATAQPCAQMTMQDPVAAAMGQTGDTLAGDDNPGGDLTGSGIGALASMDCAQHCSDLGTANLMVDFAHYLADAPLASVIAAFKLVYPDLVPLPPRPGTAS